MVSALVLGMITLIRPVNILILFSIPFLAGDIQTLKYILIELLKYWKSTVIAILLFIIPLILQLIIYKLQTGSFWVYAYGEEKFLFTHPHIYKMLFSYQKGLFIYTPLWFISLGGLYFLFREQKQKAILWLGFFVILTYILSSWHQWYYGGSFGSRAYVEYYAFFSILLSYLLMNIRKKIPMTILLSVISILIIYSVIQTYQYYAGIMDKELYWKVFLKFR